ncbi:MAG: NADH-quinone oxidoreductase subunit L [Firmicutes bacterium]|nr:NADH-quinone oxidoreductase subunit L [Bacillota bacterium]
MESTTPVLLLIVALPLAGSLITAANRNRWKEGTLARVASTAVALSFAATLVALGLQGGAGGVLRFPLVTWGPAGGFELSLGLLGDSISLWWALVVTGVGFLIHVYSSGYMHGDPGFGRYYAKLNYFVFAMSLLVLSDNYVGLLIGWANVGLASFMLIGFWNQRAEAAAAAMKAFVMNVIGEIGLILGTLLLIVHAGSAEFDTVFAAVRSAEPALVTSVGLLFLVAAVAKSAQLPLHTWLPDAMQGPTPVSALIHAATMVTAGVYLVVRSAPIYLASETAALTVAYVGGLSALFGAVVALRQPDIKKVLAFSTMSQVGYMMMAAGAGAYTAAMFHFMTHAFFKAALFLAAGIVIHYLGGEQDIRRMGSLRERLPVVYWLALFSVLALAGAPPLAGFFSKEEILHGVKDAGLTGLWILGVAVAGLTAWYMFRLFSLVFLGAAQPAGKGRREGADENVESRMEMVIPVGVLTALSVVGGWISIPGLTALPEKYLLPALQRVADVPVHRAVWSTDALLVTAVAAAGAVFALSLYGAKGSWRRQEVAARGEPGGPLYNGFYLDALYRTAVVRPTVAVSSWVGRRMDPEGVDGIVHGIAGAVKLLGRALASWHAGLVRSYVFTIVLGVVGVLAYILLAVQ